MLRAVIRKLPLARAHGTRVDVRCPRAPKRVPGSRAAEPSAAGRRPRPAAAAPAGRPARGERQDRHEEEGTVAGKPAGGHISLPAPRKRRTC